MIQKDLVEDVTVTRMKDFFCEGCQYGKQHKLSFTTTERRKHLPGERIYCDLCGPMQTPSVGGARYCILFKDDASGYCTVMLIKHKSDSLDCFKQYVNLCKNKFSRTIKVLHTDNGTEFCNFEFQEYLSKLGIQHETTAAFTPEQNARLERENRTVVESARSMLYTKDLPKNLWGEAVHTAVYILNRTPTTQIPNSTPFEMWYGKKPILNHIRVFGSEAYMLIPKQKRTKLEPKGKKLILVGYEKDSTNYRLFEPVSKKITISRHVVFNESKDLQLPRKNTILIQMDDEETHEQIKTPENHDEKPAEEMEDKDAETTMEDKELEKETRRILRPREKLHPPIRYEANLIETDVPLTYDEAMNNHDSRKWRAAILEELEALKKNYTWDLLPLPPGKRSISSKWVFKVKRDADGQIQRHKARLVA